MNKIQFYSTNYTLLIFLYTLYVYKLQFLNLKYNKFTKKKVIEDSQHALTEYYKDIFIF